MPYIPNRFAYLSSCLDTDLSGSHNCVDLPATTPSHNSKLRLQIFKDRTGIRDTTDCDNSSGYTGQVKPYSGQNGIFQICVNSYLHLFDGMG